MPFVLPGGWMKGIHKIPLPWWEGMKGRGIK